MHFKSRIRFFSPRVVSQVKSTLSPGVLSAEKNHVVAPLHLSTNMNSCLVLDLFSSFFFSSFIRKSQ